MTRRIGRRIGMVAVLGLTLAAWPIIAGAGPSGEVATPTVSGPITTGNGVSLLSPDVSSLGYVKEEYFIEGEATAYKPTRKLTSNGKWRVKDTKTAPYKTRMVVWKPADAAAFNGTVFLEWLNVSPGFDNPPDWLSAHNYFVRSGAIWVGVSAQKASVSGGERRVSNPLAPPPGGLRAADPERYGTLEHPGDVFSYDIFTQAGAAVAGKGEAVKPLGGYDVQRVLAIGESQSAFRMTTYINAVHPLVGFFDGFFVHSRGGSSAPFGEQELGKDDPDIPNDVRIRSDVDVPVLTFETEGDLVVLGFTPARQPDSKNFRLWEAAGTSHADTYFTLAFGDLGDGKVEATMLNPANATGGALDCPSPNNAGGQYAIVEAGLSALDTWVRDGTPPPHAPRLETKGKKKTIVRDEHGIARGGIRTPLVDVPIATNDGKRAKGESFCLLFGHMKPFDAEKLAELYPNGAADYVPAFEKSADKTVEAGFWLQEEADNYKAAARTITFESAGG
jgi:hypothetical protein